jgi:hypothetical protein
MRYQNTKADHCANTGHYSPPAYTSPPGHPLYFYNEKGIVSCNHERSSRAVARWNVDTNDLILGSSPDFFHTLECPCSGVAIWPRPGRRGFLVVVVTPKPSLYVVPFRWAISIHMSAHWSSVLPTHATNEFLRTTRQINLIRELPLVIHCPFRTEQRGSSEGQ